MREVVRLKLELLLNINYMGVFALAKISLQQEYKTYYWIHHGMKNSKHKCAYTQIC